MFHLIEIVNAGVITDAPTFQNIGMSVLNFLLSVAGIIAIIFLVVSGIMYFVSFGNENRMELAKRSAKYAIVGIILILGGMIIVRSVGRFFE